MIMTMILKMIMLRGHEQDRNGIDQNSNNDENDDFNDNIYNKNF